jgi:hypothetical protein
MAYGNEGPQKRLDNRRTEMYELWLEGRPLKDIVRTISGKYKATENAIYVDWNRRDTWGIVLAEPEEDFILQDFIQKLRKVEAGLWELTKHKDKKIALAAFKQIGDMAIRRMELDQTLGRVHREPTRIAFEEEVDRLHAAVEKVAGADKKLQKQLVRTLMEVQHAGDNASQN